MHIAQFVHRYPPALGGAEAWIARLSRALAADGEQVVVWTTTALDLSAFWANGHRETPSGSSVEDGVHVRRFAVSGQGQRYLRKAISLLPHRRWQALTVPWSPQSRTMLHALHTDTARPDVVHASAFPYASILEYARQYAQRHDVPLVLTPFVHTGDLADPHNRIRRVYTAPYLARIARCADRILVQTPTEADAVAQMGVRTERIVLQGLGVDPSECSGGQRDATRSAWSVGDEVVVGHLANQSHEKGTVDLLQAALLAHERGQRFRVVLAGSQMPNFQAFWSSFSPVDWVTQLGPLNDQSKRDFYAAIDVFAMPSRSDSFGLVYLEAWANGVPVIGYRAGGVADVIRHGHDGFLVRCGDLDELARSITQLVGDHEQRRSYGQAGQARLPIDFCWQDKIAIAHQTLRHAT